MWARTLFLLTVSVALFVPVAVSAADDASPSVVITKDGQRIELVGELLEKGSRVVFRDGQGRLLSLPRSAVDFEAMRRQSQTEPVEPATSNQPLEPVLVLTDKDVSRFERQAPEASPSAPRRSETKTTSEDDGADAPRSAAVEVLSWDAQVSEEDDEEGIEIWGSLQNTGAYPVDAIVVEVRLVSADSTVLANQKVTASANVLGVSDTANFSAYFDGQIFYDDIEFVVSFNELSPGQAPLPMTTEQTAQP